MAVKLNKAGSSAEGQAAVVRADPRSTTMSRIGGVAAMLVVAALITGLLGLAIELPGLSLRNWLVVLFGINAGAGQLPTDALRVFYPLDLAVLVLVGVTFIGLQPALGRVSRMLLVIAAGLPFIGILLLLATSQAGRSSVMGAGLVIAFLMFRSGRLGRLVAYIGMLANGMLLVGDFVTATSTRPLIAVLFGRRLPAVVGLVRDDWREDASV